MDGQQRDPSTHAEDSERFRKQLEAVCNNATSALFITDEQHACVYMNPAAEQLTGYTFAELRGQHLHGLLHHTRTDGSPYPVEECPIARSVRDNGRCHGTETLVHKSGWFYPISYTISPIGRSSEIAGTVLEIRDIAQEQAATQQMQATVEELRRTEQLLREESTVVDTINRVGQLIAGHVDLKMIVNAATEATTRLTHAQFGAFFYNVVNRQGESYMLYTLAGVPIEAFSKFPMPRNTEVFAATFRGEGVVRSDDIRRDPRYGKNAPYNGMPEGHLPVVSYLAVPVISRVGEVLGGLFFGHDQAAVFDDRDERVVVGIAAQTAAAIEIARMYQAEQASRAEKESLLANEQEARNELEKTSRMKDEFLATLSHELRTPLNAILGYATLLQVGALSPAEVQEGLQTIERNARLQAQLIEDLLDMNRIISGKVRLDVQLIDLPVVIDAALDTIRPSAEAKGIRLQKLLDPLAGPVKGDPGRIQQIVWNLLSNAVKFTPRGGTIQVLLERVNSHVEISVHDSGVGIAPDFLPFVFDRFRQADSTTTRRHGGLGLGLSIVKQLSELHGGSVRAKSPGEGQGATFIIALPMTVVHPEEREKPRHPKAQKQESEPCEVLLAGVRVLVVDDELDACRLVKRILEDCKAVVETAQSVKHALALLGRQTFDVLVSDIGMADEDGYDLIRTIRGLGPESGGGLPAVALTAFVRSEDRTRAALAGFQTHLAKPVDINELVAVVANLAGRTGKK